MCYTHARGARYRYSRPRRALAYNEFVRLLKGGPAAAADNKRPKGERALELARRGNLRTRGDKIMYIPPGRIIPLRGAPRAR